MAMTLTPYLHMVPGALLLIGALTDLMGQREGSLRARLAGGLMFIGVIAVGVMMISAAFAPTSDSAVLWLHRGFAVTASLVAVGAMALRDAQGGSLRWRQLRMISVGLVGLLAAVAVAGGFAAHQRRPAEAPTPVAHDATSSVETVGLCRPPVASAQSGLELAHHPQDPAPAARCDDSE